MTDAIGCPRVDQDMTAWDFNRDPFAIFDEWRAMGPVVFNERNDRYLVTSYRTCARVLADVTQFDSGPNLPMFLRLFGGRTMEAYDNQRHHELRGIWSRDFQRDTLEAQRDVIAQVVASQVDPFVERLNAGEVLDAIPNMTRGIPTLVIAHMLGIEPNMYTEFATWSDAMAASVEAIVDPEGDRGGDLFEAGDRGTSLLTAHLAEVIKERARRPAGSGDLVDRMLASDFFSKMEADEIVASNVQLVFAGNETTAKLMASALMALAQHPDQRRAVVADRSLIPQMFEECQRWATLVQFMPRYSCSDDARVGDVVIPRGAELMPLLGAGNRDPERWEHPERFDIHRPQRQHLGFGFGMHVCLGQNLARMEAHMWLDRLLDQLPDFEVAAEIDFGRNFGLRGPLELHLAAAS